MEINLSREFIYNNLLDKELIKVFDFDDEGNVIRLNSYEEATINKLNYEKVSNVNKDIVTIIECSLLPYEVRNNLNKDCKIPLIDVIYEKKFIYNINDVIVANKYVNFLLDKTKLYESLDDLSKYKQSKALRGLYYHFKFESDKNIKTINEDVRSFWNQKVNKNSSEDINVLTLKYYPCLYYKDKEYVKIWEDEILTYFRKHVFDVLNLIN